jgi:alkanesulfonate monooxygenase SsuD/methylene tetrahydromethanopterin reductase-like flavin-dependent oxidoreductase (luciferase family)
MEIGFYTVGEHVGNPHTGQKISAQQRILELIEASKLADEVGLDVFAVGERHQDDTATQAHSVILGAIAQATNRIKIASSATVLSVHDPVRVFEDFATIDLISNGRAELIAGRGSTVGTYYTLGYNVEDYEALFEEKFNLLLKLNEEEKVTWQGEFRAPLDEAHILPRPLQGRLPIWRAVGGTPASATKAGLSGVPLTLATLSGMSSYFKNAIDAYRHAAREAGHDAARLPIATTTILYVAEDSQDARKEFYPHMDHVFRTMRGSSFPEQQFMRSANIEDALTVGSPQLIVEKLLHQYELYGHQRVLLEMDLGGVPYDKLARNIELVAKHIAPAIRKYTKKSKSRNV